MVNCVYICGLNLETKPKHLIYGIFPEKSGGEGEIRTHETREGLTVFKTVAINRSATSPIGFSTLRRVDQKSKKNIHLQNAAPPTKFPPGGFQKKSPGEGA
jgi:hypothetical protein